MDLTQHPDIDLQDANKILICQRHEPVGKFLKIFTAIRTLFQKIWGHPAHTAWVCAFCATLLSFR